MHAWRWVLSAAVLGILAIGARADTTVELKNVHLCCQSCVSAVERIAKKVDGVTAKCDRKQRTVTLTAPDDGTAQKALDALAAGGFHGDSDKPDLAIKDDSGVSAGKVQSLTVTGIHNCCGACCQAIKRTVKKVDGVTGDTAKVPSRTFTVSGDFDAAELVKALNAAGFHVKVKQ